VFLRFLLDGLRAMATAAALTLSGWDSLPAVAAGAVAYGMQLSNGLVVTGMSDQVSWGFYISNFAFLVGIAAAAVLLVIPAYIFHRDDIKSVVLIGEGLAVAAVIGAMTFVIVDLGRPGPPAAHDPRHRPLQLAGVDAGLGCAGAQRLPRPQPGDSLLRALLPLPREGAPFWSAYFPFVVLSMFWAISIHTVTAFLFAASTARPFWSIALLAPRFIATAFVSGPALIIIVLQVLRRTTRYPVPES
jgi:Ni/Fe-hydrogenase subunit HybB-like protein